MYTYKRKSHYYETDQMGIIHHSNYVRWMEEARIAFLDAVGLNYAHMEECGVVSPVTSVSLSYKKPVKFDECIAIDVNVSNYNGVTFDIVYTMRSDKTNEITTQATSSHVFLSNGKIVSLKKAYPTLHEKLQYVMEKY